MTKPMKQYEGGYYLINQDLIRSGMHAHTTAISSPISEETLRALNAVQRTPWRINRWLFDVMLAAYTSGLQVGDLPYVDLVEVPRKTDEEWEALSEEDKSDWKRRLSEIHGDNARMEARRHGFLHKLDIAREMKDRESIWFPHFLDFRGRFYPMPQDLHTQGDDISRSLLEFAEGKPLGARGLFWLGVRLANTFGEDKMSLQDRYKWAIDHSDDIFDSADNPLDGRRFWADADEPWSFLATCHEWAQAMTIPDAGYGMFISHLPIQLDGSCNGLQHLAAMARDPIAAKAVNLADNKVRQDIYSDVATIVKRRVSDDAAAGDENAHKWLGRVERKTVKRSVMTTPYGVTPRGISEQLVKDGFTKGMGFGVSAANYLRDRIVEGLDQTITSAKQIMAWIQAVATALSRHNIPFRFTTPTGNVIQQSYYNLNGQRITTLLGQLIVWEEDKLGGLNDRKQMLASAPNLIHAFDASHLARTVNAISVSDVYSDYHTSFSMIHDSFGTHACDTDRLSKTLREEFVRIYSENWLEKIEAEVRSYAPDVDIPSYREFVTLGTFDVNEVRNSEFFFA